MFKEAVSVSSGKIKVKWETGEKIKILETDLEEREETLTGVSEMQQYKNEQSD